MLPPFIPPLLIRVLNALLAREEWAGARLRAHAGKAVRLDVAGLDLTLAITPNGSLVQHAGNHPAVTVRVAAADFRQLLVADPQQRMQAIHIQGEAGLAQVVSELARDLRWDAEDELAGLMGDIPAGILLRSWRGAGELLREGTTRLTQNATEYAVYEAHMLVTRPQLEELSAQIRRLDADLDGLAERLSALGRVSQQ